MTTKDIRPTHAYIPCDICGRTLLRGERAEVFIAGGNRHQVCELCKPRALAEGWIREGSVPDYDPAVAQQERRRSMFGRRRRGRDAGTPGPATSLDEALSGGAWPTEEPPVPDSRGAESRGADAPGPPGLGRARRRERTPADRERSQQARNAPRERGQRERAAARDRLAAERAAAQRPEPGREPRHVHAVPTGEDSRIAAAAGAFNQSEHPRTVAGVSRSLGAPAVAVIPDPVAPSLVRIVASWELCWYRYEVDLGADRASVRLDAQGYELSELSARERHAVAAADEAGRLHVG
jgi:hypothetical protein